MLFRSSSGVEWLDGISSEQVDMVMPYIDPDFWSNKFQNYMADVEWCKHVLQEAGL